MAKIELIMPKMGESIMEATILNWVKNVGDKIELDETILEIATDKVDSEIPSPAEGILTEILFQKDDVVAVGTVIAVISTEGSEVNSTPSPALKAEAPSASAPAKVEAPKPTPAAASAVVSCDNTVSSSGSRFYSPLVKTIAKRENISQAQLDQISGTGRDGRVTKADILAFVDQPQSQTAANVVSAPAPSVSASTTNKVAAAPASPVQVSGGDEIIEMDRMRKLIADHMVMSKHTSPHVTSFIEADVTNLVNWRNKHKDAFLKTHGEKITFTPIIIEAVIKAIKDFPMINVSLNGTQIIKKKNINIGMATALPTGNLIVPVIKNADQLNLVGITKQVNGLAGKARANKLKPTDIQDGTFTVTNVGTFGNVMGTPIINQPQVAIMAAGAIRKKPAVVETEYGDVIAIRQMMFLSLSYDHRVVDGFLGGSFLRRIGDYLEAFDASQSI